MTTATRTTAAAMLANLLAVPWPGAEARNANWTALLDGTTNSAGTVRFRSVRIRPLAR